VAGSRLKLFFLDIVHLLIFNEAGRFGSRLRFRLQARKVANLEDPSNRGFLGH
jgi:hypothetical protein